MDNIDNMVVQELAVLLVQVRWKVFKAFII